MNDYELLPCPFCGSKNIVVFQDQYGWTVKCHGCYVKITSYYTERSAINAWNRRPTTFSSEKAKREINDIFKRVVSDRDPHYWLDGEIMRWGTLENDLRVVIEDALRSIVGR